MDNKRDQIGKLYSDSTVLIYEGHRINGRNDVGLFLKKLPKSSHKVTSLDVHPVNPNMTGDVVTILISGIILYYFFVLLF